MMKMKKCGKYKFIITQQGERYGFMNKITHDKAEPVVEFYHNKKLLVCYYIKDIADLTYVRTHDEILTQEDIHIVTAYANKKGIKYNIW